MAAVALAGLTSVVVAPSGAGAASNGLWSVFPTAPPGEQAQPYVTPELTPGTQSGGSVTIDNYTGEPLSVDMYAADAFNTAGGGLSLRRQIDPQVGIGRWLHLDRSHVVVAPRSATEVGYVIDTPDNAAPGDHVGGIVAEETTGTPARAGAVPITVLEAVGVRVYARVRGPLHPRLSLSRLSVGIPRPLSSQFGGQVTAKVHLTVRDVGNTVVTPTVRVSMTNLLGRTGSKVKVALPELLPGSSLTSTLLVPGVTPLVHLRTSVAAVATGARAGMTRQSWAIPWGLVALVALVALLVVLAMVVLLRRRRRRPPAGASDDQAASVEPAAVR